MESVEKECGALGGLFQAIVNDMKVTQSSLKLDWFFFLWFPSKSDLLQGCTVAVRTHIFTAFVSLGVLPPHPTWNSATTESWNMFSLCVICTVLCSRSAGTGWHKLEPVCQAVYCQHGFRSRTQYNKDAPWVSGLKVMHHNTKKVGNKNTLSGVGEGGVMGTEVMMCRLTPANCLS